MKEYAIYPFQTMNITQNWNQGNHINHWKQSTNYSDKPWDEAGKDINQDFFIPQNDFIVEEVLGINSNITNSVRLKSINKLYIPYKKDPDYLYLTLTHMNEENLKQISKGQIIKKGSTILLEGKDGIATGNHFHITANLGKYYGLLKNSNNAWCFTYDKSLLPEEAFYIEKSFTNIINSQGSNFIDVPKEINIIGVPVEKNSLKNQIETTKSVKCYKNPNLDSEVIGNVKEGFYNYTEKIDDGTFIWYNIGIGYILYQNEFINIYPKIEKKEEKDSNSKFYKKLFTIITYWIKKVLNIYSELKK